jgi:hypothetical protein
MLNLIVTYSLEHDGDHVHVNDHGHDGYDHDCLNLINCHFVLKFLIIYAHFY